MICPTTIVIFPLNNIKHGGSSIAFFQHLPEGHSCTSRPTQENLTTGRWVVCETLYFTVCLYQDSLDPTGKRWVPSGYD